MTGEKNDELRARLAGNLSSPAFSNGLDVVALAKHLLSEQFGETAASQFSGIQSKTHQPADAAHDPRGEHVDTQGSQNFESLGGIKGSSSSDAINNQASAPAGTFSQIFTKYLNNNSDVDTGKLSIINDVNFLETMLKALPNTWIVNSLPSVTPGVGSIFDLPQSVHLRSQENFSQKSASAELSLRDAKPDHIHEDSVQTEHNRTTIIANSNTSASSAQLAKTFDEGSPGTKAVSLSSSGNSVEVHSTVSASNSAASTTNQTAGLSQNGSGFVTSSLGNSISVNTAQIATISFVPTTIDNTSGAIQPATSSSAKSSNSVDESAFTSITSHLPTESVANGSKTTATSEPVADTSHSIASTDPVASASHPVLSADPATDTSRPIVSADPVAGASDPVVSAEPAADASDPAASADPAAGASDPIVSADPITLNADGEINKLEGSDRPIFFAKNGVLDFSTSTPFDVAERGGPEKITPSDETLPLLQNHSSNSENNQDTFYKIVSDFEYGPAGSGIHPEAASTVLNFLNNLPSGGMGQSFHHYAAEILGEPMNNSDYISARDLDRDHPNNLTYNGENNFASDNNPNEFPVAAHFDNQGSFDVASSVHSQE